MGVHQKTYIEQKNYKRRYYDGYKINVISPTLVILRV